MDNFGESMRKIEIDRGGQISIFVIVAIVLVAGVLIFLAVRGNLFTGDIPAEFLPVYNLYSECIKEDTSLGAGLLGLQGGRIDIGDYEPGSYFSPFSSHLDFFGSQIGYWYYLSGNGIIRENAPSRGEMESELEEFIVDSLNECDFQEYYEQGFYIDIGNPKVDVSIEDENINVVVSSNLVVSKEGDSARKTKHEVEVGSNLGKNYETAKNIYDKESKEAFLEGYAIDVMRLYAPVDGVEVSCSPEIWKTREVVDDLKKGLKDNFASIKFKGNYYELDEEDDDYFVVDESVDMPVRIMFVENWPSKIEISGDGVDQELIVAEPVGNQEGLGVMGFCYVPYHYVYDVAFPVLIQVGDGLEVFQFPITVIIDNNVARVAELTSVDYGESEFGVCDVKAGNVEVYTYDTNLNPVEASVSFKCLDQVCSLGETKLGGDLASFQGEIPQCVNGYLIARAEGFADGKMIFSSNSETVADIILEREYETIVDVRVDGLNLKDGESAVIYFISDDGTKTAYLPGNNKVSLVEGGYDVEVYVYSASGILIPESKKTQCVKVSRGGLFGFFGGTKEDCFDIELPETNVESALAGGGKASTYILESELQSGLISLQVDSLQKPGTLAELQMNYEIFETLGVNIFFE